MYSCRLVQLEQLLAARKVNVIAVASGVIGPSPATNLLIK